jgi:hypothetical protein
MAQENLSISSSRAGLSTALTDELPKLSRETSPPVETPAETSLESVSSAKCAPPETNPASPAPRLSVPSRRLPRFTRAKASHRPPLALQARDLELLRTAYDYRLITTPQYLKLFSDESRDGIYRRLQRLFHHSYLDRYGNNPNAPMLYALGQRGADVLEVVHRKEAGERYVLHQLMIGDFRIALTLAARNSGIIMAWRLIDESLPIRPDGFFVLQFPDRSEGRNRAVFFLEADRSTMTCRRFVQKLETYWAWYCRGGHTAALGIRSFRILTVTRSKDRVETLLAAVARQPALQAGVDRFLFASQERASAPTSVFGPIWRRAVQEHGAVTILPPTPQ